MVFRMQGGLAAGVTRYFRECERRNTFRYSALRAQIQMVTRNFLRNALSRLMYHSRLIASRFVAQLSE
jgi:hypothetical protein